MRLPWHKTRLPEHAMEDATAAKAAAGEHLADARARDREVREVSRSLKALRQSNHFSERIAAMLSEQPRGHHAPHT